MAECMTPIFSEEKITDTESVFTGEGYIYLPYSYSFSLARARRMLGEEASEYKVEGDRKPSGIEEGLLNAEKFARENVLSFAEENALASALAAYEVIEKVNYSIMSRCLLMEYLKALMEGKDLNSLPVDDAILILKKKDGLLKKQFREMMEEMKEMLDKYHCVEKGGSKEDEQTGAT